MVWDEAIREQFDLVNLFTSHESEFYGPYNSLLGTLFPVSEHYQVAPQYKQIAGSLDFTVLYIVRKRQVPVFFLEIKTYVSLDNMYTRASADSQMRARFLEFSSGSIPIPKLFGISAMGTQFAVYELTTNDGRLKPKAIASDPEFVTDTAPAERWSYNVMDDVGEAKLKAIVDEVKQMSLDLQ